MQVSVLSLINMEIIWDYGEEVTYNWNFIPIRLAMDNANLLGMGGCLHASVLLSAL